MFLNHNFNYLVKATTAPHRKRRGGYSQQRQNNSSVQQFLPPIYITMLLIAPALKMCWISFPGFSHPRLCFVKMGTFCSWVLSTIPRQQGIFILNILYCTHKTKIGRVATHSATVACCLATYFLRVCVPPSCSTSSAGTYYQDPSLCRAACLHVN